eukprot:2467104-Amphidinium_carterae.1
MKAAVQQFRGIAVSGFTRSLYTTSLLMLLNQFLPQPALFSYAYARNRSASALQLALQTTIFHMKRWYGQACLIKTDVVSAFDNVSWRSIVEALEDTGLPPPFIDVLIQSQMAGYELHWEKQVQQTIWVPTSGVRQGCKLGP